MPVTGSHRCLPTDADHRFSPMFTNRCRSQVLTNVYQQITIAGSHQCLPTDADHRFSPMSTNRCRSQVLTDVYQQMPITGSHQCLPTDADHRFSPMSTNRCLSHFLTSVYQQIFFFFFFFQVTIADNHYGKFICVNIRHTHTYIIYIHSYMHHCIIHTHTPSL